MSMLELVQLWIKFYEWEKTKPKRGRFFDLLHRIWTPERPEGKEFQPDVWTPETGCEQTICEKRGVVPREIVANWHLSLVAANSINGRPVNWHDQRSAILISVPGHENRFAITAGHGLKCELDDNKEYWVMMGTNMLSDFSAGGRLLKAKLLVNLYHENNTDSDSDLAVFRILGLEDEPSDLGITVMSMKELDASFHLHDPRHGVVLGWGWNHPEHPRKPVDLRFAVMEPKGFSDGANQLFYCWSFDERGPMRFDSGGPFVVIKDNKLKLSGIVQGIRPEDAAEGQFRHLNDRPVRFLAPAGLLKNIDLSSD